MNTKEIAMDMEPLKRISGNNTRKNILKNFFVSKTVYYFKKCVEVVHYPVSEKYFNKG